jgi:hypothetical protein
MSTKKNKKKKNTVIPKITLQSSEKEVEIVIKEIIEWYIRWLEGELGGIRLHLDQVMPDLNRVCDWLRKHYQELYEPVWTRYQEAKVKIEKADDAVDSPEAVQRTIVYNYISDLVGILQDTLKSLKSAVQKPSLKGQVASDKAGGNQINQPITLKNFINTFCNLSAKPDVQSKVDLLHEYNRKRKIKLPKLAQKYKRGQYKYYFVDDLKKNWGTYQIKAPTLPPLK